MQQKIAFVKTGWSKEYSGEPVIGRHERIREAHERFNFRRAPDGRFCGYLPPIGPKYRPPQPEEGENWLVIFVAARNGGGPLTVVGWYDDAVFNKEYQIRPEYQLPSGFDKDSEGNEYTYCVHAEKGQLIPESERKIIVPGDHFKKSPIIYARRGKSSDQDLWRQEFVEIAKEVVKHGENKKRVTDGA